MFLHRITLSLICFLLAAIAPAQYRVHSWESFEESQWPDRVLRGHAADETSVVVKSVDSLGLPLQITTAAARLELGNNVLTFAPTAKQNILSVFLPVSLDRQNLGGAGSALYQADFYFPPEGEPIPTVALLAQVLGSKGQTTYRFYRFGVEEGKNRVFFAALDNTLQPDLFLFQDMKELEFKRPGWHRFQIIFHGQNQIYCAVDGAFTSFSPITEGKHTQLNAGIMVSSAKYDSTALVDNLSIQWTTENTVLPISPWISPAVNAAAPNTTPLETGAQVAWLNDPNEAWARASAQKRPILAMFYVPGIVSFESLKQTIPNDAETASLFNRYVMLSVDANQLMGGKLAAQFRVIRLPTFVVIDPSGAETRRYIATPDATWPEVKAAIFGE